MANEPREYEPNGTATVCYMQSGNKVARFAKVVRITPKLILVGKTYPDRFNRATGRWIRPSDSMARGRWIEHYTSNETGASVYFNAVEA